MTNAPSGPRETGTFLDRIVAGKRDELERLLRERPIGMVREEQVALDEPLDFEMALRERAAPASSHKSRLALIAEIKRASPSKGKLMRRPEEHQAIARTYTIGGASAISVVTEEAHFSGSPRMLREVRGSLDGYFPGGRPPLLRKDFLFDPYHIDESRAYGADALLLIVALLDDARLRELLAQTLALGMAALVEVHDADEMRRAADAGARIIGINNRDLRTFEEDLGTTERLAKLAPPGSVLVSESAIRSAADVSRVAAAGAHAILVGEALLTSTDMLGKMRELRG